MKKALSFVLAAAAVFSLLFSGCGSDDKDKPSSTAGTSSTRQSDAAESSTASADDTRSDSDTDAVTLPPAEDGSVSDNGH